MSFQIDTSFSVTEPTAAVGTDMFLVGGVMYYLALQADHLMVYTAPTAAGEAFTELFRVDLPVGFVPNEARIGDVLDGQFLISVYSNSGDYQAHFYEVKPYFLGTEFGGYNSELVATYVPSSASSTYRLKPARWSYGTKNTFLFVGRYGTNGDFAVFKGADGVVQAGYASTIIPDHAFARYSVVDRGLQWWDEDEQVWYRATYPNSGNVSNDDAYLCTVDLQGVGTFLYSLHSNAVYDNAYRRDGKFYATQHTQSSTRLQEISKTKIVESIPIGSDFGTSPYVFGHSKRPMNYGKPSGYMYSASSGGYGVWYNRGAYTTSTHPTPNLATTGFVRYTVSLREDTPELLPYSLSPYSKHAVRDTALFGDYGLSMGTGLGTKPSTTLSVGSAIGDVTQNFYLAPPDVTLLEPKEVARQQTEMTEWAPVAYWGSPDVLYFSAYSALANMDSRHTNTGNTSYVRRAALSFAVQPANNSSPMANAATTKGWPAILWADDSSFIYASDTSSGAGGIYYYDGSTTSTLLSIPTISDNGGTNHEVLAVGGQLSKDGKGIWICTNFSGAHNYFVEDYGQTLTPIANDDPQGYMTSVRVALPMAGGNGNNLFSLRQGWHERISGFLPLQAGSWLSVSSNRGANWTEIERADYNSSDVTGRVTSAAMMGEALYYTKHKDNVTLTLFKYDWENTQSVELFDVPFDFALPSTVYNNKLNWLLGSAGHDNFYYLTAEDTLTYMTLDDIGRYTDYFTNYTYTDKGSLCSEYGAIVQVGSDNGGNETAVIIPSYRLPDRTKYLTGWVGTDQTTGGGTVVGHDLGERQIVDADSAGFGEVGNTVCVQYKDTIVTALKSASDKDHITVKRPEGIVYDFHTPTGGSSNMASRCTSDIIYVDDTHLCVVTLVSGTSIDIYHIENYAGTPISTTTRIAHDGYVGRGIMGENGVGFVCTGEYELTLHKTTDYGKTWGAVPVPTERPNSLSNLIRDVQYHPDTGRLILLCGAGYAASGGATIYSTTDDGTTWDTIYYRHTGSSATGLILSMEPVADGVYCVERGASTNTLKHITWTGAVTTVSSVANDPDLAVLTSVFARPSTERRVYVQAGTPSLTRVDTSDNSTTTIPLINHNGYPVFAYDASHEYPYVVGRRQDTGETYLYQLEEKPDVEIPSTVDADLQWLPSPTPVIPPLQWDTTVAATSAYTYINPTQVRSGASGWDGAVSDERSTGKLYMEFHFEQYAFECNVVITPASEALGSFQAHFLVGTSISNEVDASPTTGATTSMSGKYSTDTGLGCNAILYDIDTNTVTVWNADTVVYTGSFASTIGDLVAGKADPVTGFRAGVQSYYTTKWTYCNFGQDLANYPWAYPHRAL